MLASYLHEDDGYSNTTVTILIPDMNFTCNGTLAGFTFAGINRREGHQDLKIQIWRENVSKRDGYHKIGHAISVNISEEDIVCADSLIRPKKGSRIFWCILNENFRLSIQPRDILGLELPPTHDNDFDIFFTRGRGPNNFVFGQNLNSMNTVILSQRNHNIQQLPQVSFSLTSGKVISTVRLFLKLCMSYVFRSVH